MGKSKVYSISDLEFIQLVSLGTSYSDCLRKLGLSSNGGSSTDILKRRIRELGCSVGHFSGRSSDGEYKTYSLDEILVENSTYLNISRLKSRIIKEGLIDYKCSECGISEWQGKPLSLLLDHINGINNDHRLENLRFLCPNCHSLTDTYAGKNKGK